jgi:Ca-activated chloride channel family protein
MKSAGSIILVLLCAATNIGWFGAERDRASEGNRLYDAGRYDEAEDAYGEGLVDHPESEPLRFNLGAAQYRQENLTDAISTLEKLLPNVGKEAPFGSPPSEAPDLAADAAYNVGNARYQLGKKAEEQDPQQALALYDEAMLAYKWAMALDPEDESPKFNHEFVERHAAVLRERLQDQEQDQQQQEQEQGQQGQEEQQQEQERGGGDQEQSEGEQQPRPDQEGEQDQQPQEQERSAEDQPEQEQPEQEQAQQDGGSQQDENQAQQEPEAGGQEQAGAAGETEAEPQGDEMTAAEARTLIDAARGEEVDPAEIRRQLGVAGIGEPKEDW